MAEIRIPKETTSETYYIGIYQDIEIDTIYPAPTTHDLFCFSFDLATACGFRSKDHPEGWEDDKTTYGNHQIIAKIDWFDHDPALEEFRPKYPQGEDPRKASTEARVWETTNDATITTTYSHPTSMTSYACRSYRPINNQATWVRVGVIVEGHLPKDAVTDLDRVYFDNLAFYMAPAITPVEATDLLEVPTFKNLRDLNNTLLKTNLQMRALVDVVNTPGRDYLKIRGEIRNQDYSPITNLPARALDIGFALPIDGATHQLVWWDDMRNSEEIYSSPNLLPFRMTGPIDSRPELKNSYPQYTAEMENLRSESTQISAYPYSALDIDTTGGTRALSFGDDLEAGCVALSHFGYRVSEPGSLRGEYYVEFRLGALPEGPAGNVTPFSFILFRSDDPTGVTTSNFREATDDYQTDIFPDFFTRPVTPPNSSGILWQYGGAFYQPVFVQESTPPFTWVLDSNTFNDNTEEYGFKYTQERYTGNEVQKFRDHVNAGNDAGVSTLIYRLPWRARFINAVDVEMNHFETLEGSRASFTIPYGDPWPAIYEAQKEYGLKLPGGINLFSRNIYSLTTSNLKEVYHFPVLLVDASFGTLDLVDKEREYISTAYSNVSDLTKQGLQGIEFDNTFFDKYQANHLDFDPGRRQTFVTEKNGTLTYSINHLEPAIPQLAANVWYLDQVALELTDIDSVSPWGDGQAPLKNLDHELLSVNANEPVFGGSKYGIMHSDTGAFESSTVKNFNKTDRSQNFRRTMARDKNITRLIHTIQIATCIINTWQNGCEAWDNLWGTGGYDALRTQLMYEASWISLAWGFMPSISNIYPEEYDYYEQHVRPIFGDDTIPPYGLALTSIFRELHLAGWRPLTQVDIEYIYNKDDVDLYVERYGDVGWGGNAVYFTVLNNDGLSLTVPKLAKMYATTPFAEKSIDEIMTEEEFEEYQICDKDFACDDFPATCPTAMFDDLHKDFFLHIRTDRKLGLLFGVGNLTGIQMIYRPENSAVCNWSAVRDWKFTEGYPSQHYSMLRILSTNTIEIGGPWTTMLNREHLSIPDKVLYVFKLWRESKVDNGDGGEGGERSTSDSTGEAGWRGARYERYGTGWQTSDTAGYNGSVDSVAVADTNACAYFAINTSIGGELDVLAHFPVSNRATAAAQYDVYITDYLQDPAGEIELGDPTLTRVIDQSDDYAYSTAAVEEGFIIIGTVDVSLAPNEIKTIVVKLSPFRDQASISPSALLVSDAVMVRESDRAR